MAGSLNRGADTDELSENHEINVTPFIDVMLVLLIIFMVAAPLATVDIKVDLPTSAAPAQPRPDTPLYVTVESDLSISVGDDAVSPRMLAERIAREAEGDTETRIFLRADKAVSYGDLMGVMNLLRIAGYTRIALVGLESVPAGGSAPAVAAD